MIHKIKDICNKHVCFLLFTTSLLFWSRKLFLFQTLVLIKGEDEIGTISAAAVFAGYDWQQFISKIKFYNIGYTMFLAPVFRMCNDVVSISKGMLFCNIILLALSASLLFLILKKAFRLPTWVNFILSFFCGTAAIGTNGAMKIQNEVPFRVWFLLVILMIIIVNEQTVNTKKRRIYSVVFWMVFSYGYMIHARFLVAAMAILGAMVVCDMAKRKISKVWFWSPVGVLMLFLLKQFLSGYKASIWNASTTSSVTNSTELGINYGINLLKTFFSADYIVEFLKIFISLFFILIASSAGLFILALVGNGLMILFSLKKGRKADGNQLLVTLIVTITTVGMFLITAMMAMTKGDVKWLYYTRYVSPFCVAFIGSGIASVIQLKEKRKLIMVLSLVVAGLSIVAYAYLALRHSEYYYSGMVTNYLFWKDITDSKKALMIIIVFFLVLLLTEIYFVVVRNKYKLVLLTVLLLSMAFRISADMKGGTYTGTYELINGFEELKKDSEIEKYNIEYAGTPAFAHALRFAYYDIDMEYIGELSASPNYRLKEKILFTNVYEYAQMFDAEYVLELDEGEYVIFNNRDFLNEISKERKVEYCK